MSLKDPHPFQEIFKPLKFSWETIPSMTKLSVSVSSYFAPRSQHHALYSVLVNNTSTFTSDIHSQGYDGLLGLGPNTGSLIGKKLSGSTGYSTLQRLFQQDKMTANYISFLLDRKNDPGETFTGQITVSELVPGFENITSMPILDVETVSKILKGGKFFDCSV